MKRFPLALLALLILVGTVLPAAATPTPPATPTPGDYIPPNSSGSSTISWDPAHGYYTRWWFDPSSDFINPYGFFHSLLLPLTAVLGSYVFLILWGAIAMAFYIYTQDSTMPFVVGVLSGAILQVLMSADAKIVMVLTMVFLGGGILTKVLLGRS